MPDTKSTSSLAFRLELLTVRETVAGPLPDLRTPERVAGLLRDLQNLAQEAMTLLTLNTKYKLIDRHLVTLGIVDASLVHPREVFRRAILDNASAVILAHNHPSGDPTPSAEDIRITRQIVEAGRVLNIEVLDHVVIGRDEPGRTNSWVSMRESGLVAFNQ